jgi:elongation factor 3
MRSIAKGNLEGFPPREELRTVYVEHDIDASLEDIAVVEFVFRDPLLRGAPGGPLFELVVEARTLL